MTVQLQGLWTIQDFWIGHHNLLMRRVDAEANGNLDLRFEGTSLFIGDTALHDPLLSVIGTEHVPPWIREAYQEQLFGRTVFHLTSKQTTAGIYIAADLLWQQHNSLPHNTSSLRGKYEGPRSVLDVEAMVQRIAKGEWKEEDVTEKWERVSL